MESEICVNIVEPCLRVGVLSVDESEPVMVKLTEYPGCNIPGPLPSIFFFKPFTLIWRVKEIVKKESCRFGP